MLRGRKIGLFITGGIAAYKTADLARLFIKQGAQVRVAMTAGAQEFITPLTLQTLTKAQVLTDTFDEFAPESVQHIELADWMDLAVVAPATANTLAKLANGIADNIVTSVLAATNVARLVVPAMNTKMYDNPANQRNLAQLTQDGYTVMEPATGFLAEGYEGKGRMPEPAEIVEVAKGLLAQSTLPQLLAGKTVLVSAGGTRERIDPVRYITNDSSGKMGLAMAQVALYYGADRVILVSANPGLAAPAPIELTTVESARQLAEAMTENFDGADYVVMAAAVSDYRPTNQANHKIKKTDDKPGLTLGLVENPDILAGLAARKKNQVLIGFAAETQDLLANAQAKLAKKGADWIIANDVSQAGIGFNAEDNQVTLLAKDGQVIKLKQMTKLDTALAAWAHILGIQDEGLLLA